MTAGLANRALQGFLPETFSEPSVYRASLQEAPVFCCVAMSAGPCERVIYSCSWCGCRGQITAQHQLLVIAILRGRPSSAPLESCSPADVLCSRVCQAEVLRRWPRSTSRGGGVSVVCCTVVHGCVLGRTDPCMQVAMIIHKKEPSSDENAPAVMLCPTSLRLLSESLTPIRYCNPRVMAMVSAHAITPSWHDTESTTNDASHHGTTRFDQRQCRSVKACQCGVRLVA
jgi:hypothetical protein